MIHCIIYVFLKLLPKFEVSVDKLKSGKSHSNQQITTATATAIGTATATGIGTAGAAVTTALAQASHPLLTLTQVEGEGNVGGKNNALWQAEWASMHAPMARQVFACLTSLLLVSVCVVCVCACVCLFYFMCIHVFYSSYLSPATRSSSFTNTSSVRTYRPPSSHLYRLPLHLPLLRLRLLYLHGRA